MEKKRVVSIIIVIIVVLFALKPLYWLVINPSMSDASINPKHDFIFVADQYDASNYYVENETLQFSQNHKKYLDVVKYEIELSKVIPFEENAGPCGMYGKEENIGIFFSFEELKEYFEGEEVFKESEIESGGYSPGRCYRGETFHMHAKYVGNLSTEQLLFYLYDVESENYTKISYKEIQNLKLAPAGQLNSGELLDPSGLRVDWENLYCEGYDPIFNWYCFIPGYKGHIQGSYFEQGNFKKKINIDNFFYNRIIAWIK